MKIKTTQSGQKYMFFEDIEMDAIALKLISYLPKYSGSIGKPLKVRLWDCAYELIENSPSNSVIFKRCQTIGNEVEHSRVYSFMKEIINEIVKQAGASNEKSVKMDWDENKTRTTENGVKVRYTTNGKFIGLKTLCDVLIGNMKDIEGLLKMIDTDIENITWAKFNNLVEKVKQDQSRYGDGMVKQNFKTIRIAFEDILTEKGIDPIKENKIPHIKVDSWESGIDILE